MAITLDSTTNGPSGAVSTRTFSHVVGSGNGRFLVVKLSIYKAAGAPACSGVTYNGVALTQEVTRLDPLGTARAEIWTLANPDTGTHDVVVTLSATADNLQPTATSWFGAASWRGDTSAIGASTSPSVAVTSVSGDRVVDIVASTTAISAIGAGQTSELTSGGIGASYETATGVSTTMSWTLAGSAAWVIAAGAMIPAGGQPARTMHQARMRRAG